MSPSTKLVIVKRGAFVLVLLGVAVGTRFVVRNIALIDPYSGLKKTSKETDPNLGVRIQDGKIDSYKKGKLVSSAAFDQMDVRQDKQHYDLFGVHEGKFFSDKGVLNFDAPKGLYDVSAHQLEAPEGAHVKNKDIDLRVGQFQFRADTGDVHVPGPVQGKFYGGDLKAMSLRYNVNSSAFRAGPSQWNGKLALTFHEGTNQDPTRRWNITSEGESYSEGKDVVVYEKGTGTDGDIIVMADLIRHNRDTDVVTATGHVRYFSSKTNMICEKAVIERKIKKATLTGNVQMMLKAKEKQDTISAADGIPPYHPVVPDEVARTRPPAPADSGQDEHQKKLDDELRNSKNMRDYPTMCYADKIEYWYKKGERHAIITGNPQARQELSEGRWRQVWTKTAYYDGEKEMLKMESTKDLQDTRMINSIGDDGIADWVELSTKEGSDDWKAHKLKATLVDKSDEIPRGDKAKPQTKPGDLNGPVKSGGSTGGSSTSGGTGTTGGATGTTGGH